MQSRPLIVNKADSAAAQVITEVSAAETPRRSLSHSSSGHSSQNLNAQSNNNNHLHHNANNML